MRLRELTVSMAVAVLVGGCGGDSPTGIRDTTPPARITDLAAGHGANGYFLTWTAPGDDDTTGTVSSYDIRYIRGDIIVHWGDATRLPAPASVVAAGRTQTAKIDSLGPGVWQFAVKAADEVPNWSALSNVASVTISTPPTDTIPPAPVTDLAAEAIIGGVRLHWTAPGDNGLSGTASAYDLRYSNQPITPASWSDATPVEGVGAPKSSGRPESATVHFLQADQEYAFALRSADDKGNWSDISNSPTLYLPQPSIRQLTFSTSYYGALNPNWSPDGSSIACTMGLTGTTQAQVFVIPLSGGSPEQYTSSPYDGASPAWSPDGTRFAFSATEPGGGFPRLAVMATTPGAPRTVLAGHTGFRVTTPQWSPDGEQIAYRAFYLSGGVTISDLYSIPSAGGAPTHLAGPFTSYGLSWSSDETRIAYDSRELGTSDIWVMPSGGGAATRLTTSNADESCPAWSPDGALIAYVAEGKVWGVSPTGGAPLVLVNDTGIDRYRGLTWSPDERSLAYTKIIGVVPNIWVASVNAQE